MNNEYYKKIIQKYKEKGIIVDTNLLLLYLVGSVDLGQITKFRRTKIFVEEDFHLLQDILQGFKTIVTTPNILTEVSNFLGQLNKSLHRTYFSQFANSLALLNETYVESRELTKTPELLWLHLTDTGIVHLARHEYLVMTIDAPLANYLARQNVDVINFNHLRPYFWQ